MNINTIVLNVTSAPMESNLNGFTIVFIIYFYLGRKP